MIDRGIYHSMVNAMASFVHQYMDTARDSGAIGDDTSLPDVMVAAMTEYTNRFLPRASKSEVDNIIAVAPQSPAPQRLHLAVHVRGGTIQSIESDQPEFFTGASVLVIDYDLGETDPDCIMIEDMDGKDVAMATPGLIPVEKSKINLRAVASRLGD